MRNKVSVVCGLCVGIASVIAVIGIVLSFTPRYTEAQTTETFMARLSVMPVEAATVPDIAGSGSGSAVFDNGRLLIDGAFTGLLGIVTAARLHEGPGMGIRGTAFSELMVVGGVEGSFSGEIELSSDQVDSLRQGKIYIQIDSEAAPEGNLWGWLVK